MFTKFSVELANMLSISLILTGLAFLGVAYIRARSRELLAIGRQRLIRTSEFRRLHRRYRNAVRFTVAFAAFGVLSALLYTVFSVPLFWAFVNALVSALIFTKLVEEIW